MPQGRPARQSFSRCVGSLPAASQFRLGRGVVVGEAPLKQSIAEIGSVKMGRNDFRYFLEREPGLRLRPSAQRIIAPRCARERPIFIDAAAALHRRRERVCNAQVGTPARGFRPLPPLPPPQEAHHARSSPEPISERGAGGRNAEPCPRDRDIPVTVPSSFLFPGTQRAPGAFVVERDAQLMTERKR